MHDYLPACKVVTTHGVRGEMKALPLCDDTAALAQFATLYYDEAGTRPVKVLGVRAQGNVALIRLVGVEDMDAARALVGHTLYLARADVKLEDGRFLVDDVLGCEVRDANTNRLYGVVTQIAQPGAQEIYTVTDETGAEHMLPVVPAFVKSIDPAAHLVLVTPIPGLLDDNAAQAPSGGEDEA